MLDDILRSELSLSGVERRSLNETVYTKLKEAIINGKFRPGEKLVESVLAGSLGVSRSPVREAIYRLENDALAIVKPRVGAFVTEITVQDIEESYHIYNNLEIIAVRLALPKLNDERLKLLNDCVETMVESARKHDRHGELEGDATFHKTLIEFGDSRLLKGAVQAVLPTVQRIRALHYLSFASESRQEDLAEEHHQVLLAIRSGDEASSVRAITAHWELMKERMLQGLSSQITKEANDSWDQVRPRSRVHYALTDEAQGV